MAPRSLVVLAAAPAALLLSTAAMAQSPKAPVPATVPADAPPPPPSASVEALAPSPAEPPAVVPAQPSRLESEPDGWIDVMPGPGLAGWTRQAWPKAAPIGPQQWSLDAAAGTLTCDGTGGHDWIRFDREMGDGVFHVEWRFVPVPPPTAPASPPAPAGAPADAGSAPGAAPAVRYNSGVLVRTAPDQSVWHQAQVGDPTSGYLFGRTPVDGTVQRVNLAAHLTDFRVRPPGEWNVYEVTARGRTISLWVNGAVTSEMSVEVPRGHFGLEGEGYRIEFRNLKLKALE